MSLLLERDIPIMAANRGQYPLRLGQLNYTSARIERLRQMKV